MTFRENEHRDAQVSHKAWLPSLNVCITGDFRWGQVLSLGRPAKMVPRRV